MPRDITEAADGMGYSWSGRLFGVDLPLAMPLIIAGLRVATVTTVGLVMVTAVIGEGGLGQLMLRGFNFRNTTAVYVGAIMTVLLAVSLDLVVATIGRIATPWTRRSANVRARLDLIGQVVAWFTDPATGAARRASPTARWNTSCSRRWRSSPPSSSPSRPVSRSATPGRARS